MPNHHSTSESARAESDTAQQPAVLGPADAVVPALTERENAILDFESDWRRHSGAKEEAIRDTFGLSGARYYQVLGVLIDSPAALVADPMLVKRLQRLRAERASARSQRSVPEAR